MPYYSFNNIKKGAEILQSLEEQMLKSNGAFLYKKKARTK